MPSKAPLNTSFIVPNRYRKGRAFQGELERLLADVKRIKQGAVAQSPELFGFSIWKDVMAFSIQPEGDHLRGFVALVQEYGEDIMLRAIAKCEKEESKARVVCSTTHRAKGREWSYVRVHSDFDFAFSRALKAPTLNQERAHRHALFEAEARLLYVALTRAKIAVHLPRTVMSRFGLRPTTMGTLGRESGVKSRQSVESLQDPDLSLSEVVSPYHSPRQGESKEMMALRNILR